MPEREWHRELEFSADELAEMGAEMLQPRDRSPAPLPARRRGAGLRIPDDAVPRGALQPRAAGHPSCSDLAVEQAFEARPAPPPDDAIDLDEADVILDPEDAPVPAAGDPARASSRIDGRRDGERAFVRVDAVPEALVLDERPVPSPGVTGEEASTALSDDASSEESDEELSSAELEEVANAQGLPVPGRVDVEADQVEITIEHPLRTTGDVADDDLEPEITVADASAGATVRIPADEAPEAEKVAGAELEVVPEDEDVVPPEEAGTVEVAGLELSAEVSGELMEAALAPGRSVEDDGEELSGADIEEIQEAPPPSVPPRAIEPPRTPPPMPEGQAGRRRRGRPWFEEVFDEDHLRTLPYLTSAQTGREIAFLEGSLGVPGSHLLDLGCGIGRHAMGLAARGYEVTGLDLSLALLIKAADEAQRRGLKINFVHGDMRELHFDRAFDGVYSLSTSFGYFDDEANRKVAEGVARILRPGGRFLVEVLNRDYVVADLPTRLWWEGDGCVVLEEVDFNHFSSRLVVRRSVVFEDGRQLEQDISIRAYALHELGRVLQLAGFRVLEVTGNIATRGRFLGSASRSIMMLAERRTE